MRPQQGCATLCDFSPLYFMVCAAVDSSVIHSCKKDVGAARHDAMLALCCLILLSALGGAGARPAGCNPGGRRLLQAPALAGISPEPGPTDGSGSIETLQVDTQVSDCLVYRNRYYDVAAIPHTQELLNASANILPSETECCRSCHNNTGCNVWQWCPQQQGCAIVGMEVVFPYLGCQLLHISGFSPYAQGNLTVVSGPAVPFTAGGSVDIIAPAVDNYDLVAGADFGSKFDYTCPQSASEGMCKLYAPVENVAANCSADPKCLAFVYFPNGIDFMGPPVGMLKSNTTPLRRSSTQLNPSGVVYIKASNSSVAPVVKPGGSGSGSGANTALIAGVVGGSCGLLLLLAAAAGLAYFRAYRPRRRLAEAAAAAAQVEDKEAGEGEPAAGDDQPHGGSSADRSSRGSEGSPDRHGRASPAALAAGLVGEGGRLEGKGGGSPLLRRSNSPPSVVDAHLAGVLGEPEAALAAAVPLGSGRDQCLLEGTSPFMFFDPATIAAMQAAAPAVVQESPIALHNHAPAGSCGTPSVSPQVSHEQQCSWASSAAGTAIAMASAASGPAPQLQQRPQPQQLPGLSGWEDVVVAQVSAAHHAASSLSSPPGSMAAGSTARELLEAFAKLYRQRPTVDYSALEGVLEVDAAAGGGSASVSPQSTLGPADGCAAGGEAGEGGPSSVAQGEQQQQQQAAGAVAPPRGAATVQRSASDGLLVDAVSMSMSIVLPEVPWSDWALQPEEVEVCRRPDGSWWQLGSGACGTVYKGLYHGVQPVAVKMLHQCEDGRRSDVFMREVTMLKGLRDRNIVQFLGASLDGASAMLVTEFMELGDLWRALPIKNQNGERVFGWYRRGRRVALDVAKGLHYLHHKRVVHLDLKSANILLSRHGTAKIGDIGMARVLNRDYLTVLSGLGTFAWSAPEVLAGKRCTEKVDIYSFGVVLWEIATGEVPVRGDMRPLEAPGDCPQQVVDLHARCTAENPLDRPTAIEIVELLSSLLADPPAQRSLTGFGAAALAAGGSGGVPSS